MTPTPLVHELLDHLQPDRVGPHHHRPGAPGRRGDDPVHVLDVPQGINPPRPHPRDRGHQGRGAGWEDQLVVALLVDLTGLQIPHAHRLGGTVDGNHLMAHPRLDAESVVVELGIGHQELLPVGDLAADVIGQAAVGECDLGVPLEDEEPRLLVDPAVPCRRRGASGDTTDHEDGGKGCPRESMSWLLALMSTVSLIDGSMDRWIDGSRGRESSSPRLSRGSALHRSPKVRTLHTSARFAPRRCR